MRSTWKTACSEMGVFPVCSFPRTGTRRGPKSGSSNLISFTLERSTAKKKKRSIWAFNYSHWFNPMPKPDNSCFKHIGCLPKRYLHKTPSQKAKLNLTHLHPVSFYSDQRFRDTEILHNTSPRTINQEEGWSIFLSTILYGFSNHFLFASINHFSKHQSVQNLFLFLVLLLGYIKTASVVAFLERYF